MAEGRAGLVKPDEELKQAYDVFADDKGIIHLVSQVVIKDPESNTRLAELIEKDVLELLNRDPQRGTCLASEGW
jgi:hypothetical protein